MHRNLSSLSGLVLSVVLTAQSPSYIIFGNGCAGSAPIPRMVLVNPPAIASTLWVDVTNLPFNLAFMVTGLSRTSSPLGPLPLPLGPMGLPGCVAYVSQDTTVLLLGAGNRATYMLAIPASPGLVGIRFFHQAFVIDWLAGNAASAIVSDAAELVIGLPSWPTGGTPFASMVPIAAGAFLMGSNSGPPDNVAPYYAQANERPVHQVTISRPFWIGRYEVTQAQYQAVMNANPSWHQGPNRPVERVTWNDAMAYCAALTLSEGAAGRLPAGYQYRLPTEAEWEYCCRAGTTTEFHSGPTLLCGQAHFRYSYHASISCSNSGTVDVGSYLPNMWGLHDMHGNVYEWCLDALDGSANYPAGPVTNPYATGGTERVYRGGAFHFDSDLCRSASRSGRGGPFSAGLGVGFRVVLGPLLVP